MSNQNPNQTPNQTSGPGGYNPNQGYKRNTYRSHNPNIQYPYQQSPYPTHPEQYMAGYTPVYPQSYGYTPQGYGQGYVPSQHQKHIYNQQQHHQINLTTTTGEKVDLKALSNTTPKTANATLNKLASPSKSPAASLSPQPSPSTVASPAKNALAETFKQAVLAKAAKAKAKEEPKTETPKAKEEPKSETPKAKEEPKSETPKANEEPKTETPKVNEEPKTEAQKPEAPKIEESKIEESNIEEPKTEEPKTEKPKTEEPKTDELDTEEPKAEEPKKAESASELNEKLKQEENKAVDVKTETAENSTANDAGFPVIAENIEGGDKSKDFKDSIPETIEEVKEVKVEDPMDDVFSISKFFAVLKNAKPIENPFEFKYPEGQTAPDSKLVNEKTPKLRYDPGFLVQFANIVKFPVDEQFKEQIKFIEQGRNERSGSSRVGSNFRSFGGSKSSSNLRKFDSMNSRSNSRQGSKRRGGGNNRGDRRSNRYKDRGDRDDKEEKEPEIPLDVKPLEKSATRWIPKSRANKTDEVKYAPDGVTVLLSSDEIARKAKSLLNKLTLEYFDEISDELLEIANQSQWEEDGAAVKQVLEITFDKAVDEPHWSAMYAQFCAKLCKNISPDVKDTSLLDKDGNALSGPGLVRKYLISKCQIEYEKGWTEELPKNEDGTQLGTEMMTDEYYRIAALKRRGLGLVRLIGHLFDLGLLREAVILACLHKLVQNDEDPADDIVESLIQFVKTIGKKLDSQPDTKAKINQIFEIMKKMSTQPKIPRRLQFALLDLIDLRAARWAGASEQGPKTIKEIHEEENKKHAEEQRQKSERKRGGHNDSRSNSSRNSNWSNNNRVNDSDARSLGRVGQASSSPSGPQNFFGGKGKSARTAGPSDPATPVTSSPLAARENSIRAGANSFALLNDDDDEEHDDESDQQPTPASAEVEKES